MFDFTVIESSAELQMLPVGHYEIPSETKVVEKWFDIRTYEEYPQAPVIRVAHVVEKLPFGLTDGQGVDIQVRPDGKVILGGWIPDPKWKKAQDERRLLAEV